MSWPKGRAFSQEHRAKLSAGIREAYRRPEYRERISASLRGRSCPRTPEAQAKITEALRRPEVRARMSAALKGRPKSPEHRAALSASRKGNPKVIEACRKGGRKSGPITGGRYFPKGDDPVVHHFNGVHADDRSENRVRMTAREHMKLHTMLRQLPPATVALVNAFWPRLETGTLWPNPQGR